MTSMNHNNVVIDIMEMLGRAEPPITGDCCIYRVPFDIRRLNEDAYAPKVVSIGPFHHHRHPRLQSMERHKLIYCRKFLERAKTTLDSLISYVEEAEPTVRRCYSDTLELTKEELVKVILVDSGFIIELFWRVYYDEYPADDTLGLKPLFSRNIGSDLMLLENQLPFFVLEGLFNLSFISDRIPSFLVLAFNYFAYYNISNIAVDNNISIRHFTDLLRTFHLLPLGRIPRHTAYPVSGIYSIKSANELLDAGMKFKVNTKSNCLVDLRFSGKVLEIPQFRVDDRTEILFCNLVALEQCYYTFESYVTDYVAVLHFLINTSKDVDVLVQRGILVNCLSDSDSAAKMINSLPKNITDLSSSARYYQLCRDLTAFGTDPWRMSRASWKRDYGKTPWQTAASIAGIVLLILTLLQSICSVLQVV